MSDPRDVILVTIDSIRADHCSWWGYERETTPTLDRLADEGLVFETAIAPASETFGSVTTFLADGDSNKRPVSRHPTIGDRIREHMTARDTVAEQFSRAGYETAGFSTNPWTSRFFGFDAGFDHYEDFMETDESVQRGQGGGRSVGISTLLEQVRHWRNGQGMYMSWEAIYDDVIERQRRMESPYFLWTFLVDPHMPYIPGEGYRSQPSALTYLANLWLYAGSDRFESRFHDWLITAYDDALTHTDAFLERLMEEVGEGPDAPIVVIVADHGEEFGDHGMYGHGGRLYEELVHVPLVVVNGPEDVVSEPFSLRRIPELLSRLAHGEEYDDLTEPYVVSGNNAPKVAVRGAEWKYIWSPDAEELYGIDGVGPEHRVLENDDLLEVGRDVTAGYHESEAEIERVLAGVDEAVASGSL